MRTAKLRELHIYFYVLLGTPFILLGMLAQTIRVMFMAGWNFVDEWIAGW